MTEPKVKIAAKRGVKDSNVAMQNVLKEIKTCSEYDKIKAYMDEKDKEHADTTAHLREWMQTREALNNSYSSRHLDDE